MLSPINFKGNREKWINFIATIKLQRKTVWEVLEPMIDKYIGGRK